MPTYQFSKCGAQINTSRRWGLSASLQRKRERKKERDQDIQKKITTDRQKEKSINPPSAFEAKFGIAPYLQVSYPTFRLEVFQHLH